MGQITYADKSYINENAGIAATNKVQDIDMNEIKTAVNDNYSKITTMQTGLDFSTSEVDTGKKWIDNKTIYKKVITANSLANSATLQITHGISNLGTIISQNLVWYDTADSRWFNNLRFDSASILVKMGGISGTTAYINCLGADWSSRTSNVSLTLEYTKAS